MQLQKAQDHKPSLVDVTHLNLCIKLLDGSELYLITVMFATIFSLDLQSSLRTSSPLHIMSTQGHSARSKAIALLKDIVLTQGHRAHLRLTTQKEKKVGSTYSNIYQKRFFLLKNKKLHSLVTNPNSRPLTCIRHYSPCKHFFSNLPSGMNHFGLIHKAMVLY